MRQAVVSGVTPRRGRGQREKDAPTVDLTHVMTVEQAATAAKVSVATIWRWRNQGLITSERVLGRTVFARSAIEAALRKR